MIIVANWKAKVTTLKDGQKLVALAKTLAAKQPHEIVIAPPSVFLGPLVVKRSKLKFAGQDISGTTGGAQTGEVTGVMLRDIGATHVIVGHSERRALGETNEMVTLKVKNTLSAGLIPVVCIGERERDPDAAYLRYLQGELEAIFAPLAPKDRTKIILAYEPIWAIGKSAAESITPNELEVMVGYIRKVLATYMPKKAADTVSILYGGAVEQANVRVLTEGTGVQGLLVGHASTTVPTFKGLVTALSKNEAR